VLGFIVSEAILSWNRLEHLIHIRGRGGEEEDYYFTVSVAVTNTVVNLTFPLLLLLSSMFYLKWKGSVKLSLCLTKDQIMKKYGEWRYSSMHYP
jgi:hypothetical protein